MNSTIDFLNEQLEESIKDFQEIMTEISDSKIDDNIIRERLTEHIKKQRQVASKIEVDKLTEEFSRAYFTSLCFQLEAAAYYERAVWIIQEAKAKQKNEKNKRIH